MGKLQKRNFNSARKIAAAAFASIYILMAANFSGCSVLNIGDTSGLAGSTIQASGTPASDTETKTAVLPSEKPETPAATQTAAPNPSTAIPNLTTATPGTQEVLSAPEVDNEPAVADIDYEKVKPDESGKIMVVMFHRFIKEYTSGDKLYTTTFGDFKNLLEKLYSMGYTLVGLNDMLQGNFDVPAGRIPIVFTFDDGSAGQFNLIESGGELSASENSAVGIMEDFYELHPEFGLEGTFYVNLASSPFKGSGTLAQRLAYLVDKGFEIGNHTFTHINLKKTTDAAIIQKEIADNQKAVGELVPGYVFKTFSLPYGLPSPELQHYVVEGSHGGVSYKNLGIMEVGWDPSPSPFSINFNPESVHRVRSPGIEPAEADLSWWLEKLSIKEQFVSDGDQSRISVPEAKAAQLKESSIGDKKLVLY